MLPTHPCMYILGWGAGRGEGNHASKPIPVDNVHMKFCLHQLCRDPPLPFLWSSMVVVPNLSIYRGMRAIMALLWDCSTAAEKGLLWKPGSNHVREPFWGIARGGCRLPTPSRGAEQTPGTLLCSCGAIPEMPSPCHCTLLPPPWGSIYFDKKCLW